MIPFVLNPASFFPQTPIEGYTSFIWTERFILSGDFQIKMPNVKAGLELLPISTIISHIDTLEVGVVETLEINEDENGNDELIVSGRMIESTMEFKVALFPKYPKGLSYGDDFGINYYMRVIPNEPSNPYPQKSQSVYSSTSIVSIIEQLITCMETGLNLPGVNIPVFRALQTNIMSPPIIDYIADRVQIHEIVNELLQNYNYGLRFYRPIPGIDYGAEFTPYLYVGVNRTGKPQKKPWNMAWESELTFDTSLDHFLTSKYLWTNRDYKNRCYVLGFTSKEDVNAPTIFPDPTIGTSAPFSLFRRYFLDFRATLIEDEQLGNKQNPFLDGNYDRNVEWMIAKGQAELAKNPRSILFEGEVSPDIPYEYKIDYDLGDLIRVRGNYNLDQIMLVEAYTCIDDADGSRGFPSLALP